MGIILIMILVPTFVFAEGDEIKYRTEKAEVLSVEEPEDVDGEFYDYTQKIKVRILTGSKKNEELLLENTLGDNLAYNIDVKKGDKVAIIVEKNITQGKEEVYISDYYRLGSIKVLIIIFIALIVIVGGKQGIRALVSLGLTIGAVVYILLPGMLKGYSPILLSTFVAVGVTILTMIIVTGFTKKSLAAIIGTSLGVIMAALVAFITGKTTKLTGLSAEDVTMLLYIPQGIEFNLQHLLFSGIILGTLGAVMDVGMSISSSIDEIYNANKNLDMMELFQSGMNVGKDIMGTMVNTLILAYTGSSIPILLLFLAYDGTMREIINLDMIATEIVRSVSGSIGLILTIPITSLIASFLITKFKRIDILDEEKN